MVAKLLLGLRAYEKDPQKEKWLVVGAWVGCKVELVQMTGQVDVGLSVPWLFFEVFGLNPTSTLTFKKEHKKCENQVEMRKKCMSGQVSNRDFIIDG